MADPRGPHGAMSRAQQFEDEKKRIMQSCFAKQDADGVSLLESYITHCRIVEDSASPSAPPPDGTIKGSMKERLIFVAVRKSGRVRMHKARENNNGTFSIGKTWNLDDLQAIQVHGPPNEKGFTVTILKPYYWQAGSAKEKDFFISSLIKIYRKYTGGKIPELVGFKRQELEALLGSDADRLMEENRRDRMAMPGGGSDQHVSHAAHAGAASNGQAGRSTTPSSAAQSAKKPTMVPPSMEKTPSQRSYGTPTSPAARPGPPLGPAPRPGEMKAQRSVGELAPRRPEMPPLRPPTTERERPTLADTRRPSGGSLTSAQAERATPARSLSSPKSEWDMRPGSAASNGTSRSATRSPLAEQEDKDVRRVPSLRERLRAPSSGSQTSDHARRTEERESMPSRAAERQRSREPTERARPALNQQHSHSDVASRFRQAANAYNVVGALNNQNRPKTPTTPRSATPTSMKEPTRTATDPIPSIPPLRFSDEKRPSSSKEREDSIASVQSSSSRGRPSMEETRPTASKSSVDSTPSLLRAGPPPGATPRPQQPPPATAETPMLLRPGPPAAAAATAATPRPSQQQENDTPAALRTGPTAIGNARAKDPEPLTIAKPRPTITREASEPASTQIIQPVPTVTEPLLPLEKVRSAPLPSSQHPLVTPPPQLRPKRLHDPPSPHDEPKSPMTPSVVEPPAVEPPQSQPAKEKKKKHQKKKSLILEKLDKRGLTIDLDELLDEFHWDGTKSLEHLHQDVKKELSKVESNNVIVNLDHDGRVDQLSVMLDNAIKECEEMDGLLTLYAVELSSLNDDIFHIENQSQGLQVQTANQKTLQRELGNLLDTISISPSQLNILKQHSLQKDRDVQEVEQTLVVLYKAVKTIDGDTMTPLTPTMASPPLLRRGSISEPGIGSMRALQDKKDDYRQTCRMFLIRLHQFLESKFAEEMKEVLHQSRQQNLDSQALTYGNRPHLPGHDMMYHDLWKYASLLSFVRDIDADEYLSLQRIYERAAKNLFQEEFREHVLAWKKITKTLTSDEAEDLVFTTTEKEPEHSAVTAARKLTVKKSIARIRGESVSFKERPSSHSVGVVPAAESFQGAFTELTTLVLKEQNFIVEFFALSSRAPQDFLEFVIGPDAPKRLGDLGGFHAADPDKSKMKQVLALMKDLFSFLPQELQGLVDWAVKLDPTQVVGAMYAIEQRLQKLDETDQEFLEATLKDLWNRLQVQWKKFVDVQVKAIEETKVKVKKRKGIIGFIRVFPIFATHIETQIPHSTNTPVRQTVNDAYTTLNTAIFDTLLSIANSLDPMANSSGGSTPQTPSAPSDPEDKAALNHHITLIENLHHYITALSSTSSSALSNSSSFPPPSPSFAPNQSPLSPSAQTALQPFITRAQTLLTHHIAAYTLSILHRPVGKLLDFITALEAVLSDSSTTDPSSIPNRPQFSRHSFKKILKEHDGKEVRKGIESLRKRVEKHFSDDDDVGRRGHAGDRSSTISIRSGSGTHIIPGGGSPGPAAEESQELVRVVLDKCEEELIQLHKRTMLVLVGTPYKDMGLELEFTVADVRAGFKK